MHFVPRFVFLLVRRFVFIMVFGALAVTDPGPAWAGGEGVSELPPGSGYSNVPTAKKKGLSRAERNRIKSQIRDMDYDIKTFRSRTSSALRRARAADKEAGKALIKAIKINNKRAKNQKQIKRNKSERADLNRRLRTGKNRDGSKMDYRDRDKLVARTNQLAARIRAAEKQDKADLKEVRKLRRQSQQHERRRDNLKGEAGLNKSKALKLEKHRRALKAKLK